VTIINVLLLLGDLTGTVILFYFIKSSFFLH
jgi:hypothetical protein